ncbi:hypothetical protein QJQ45_005626 [Haematococcus lacustris]|nr:hypothetical protein QJQ45_005626 [Haematococcus lacustris]
MVKLFGGCGSRSGSSETYKIGCTVRCTQSCHESPGISYVVFYFLVSPRFYDRDVSAALNIRRCAVGPGPRPTELCYWDGRPAMPKPVSRDKMFLNMIVRCRG